MAEVDPTPLHCPPELENYSIGLLPLPEENEGRFSALVPAARLLISSAVDRNDDVLRISCHFDSLFVCTRRAWVFHIAGKYSMNLSEGAVHPVEVPPLQTEGARNAPLPRVRMKDLQGLPGTVGGLVLRVSQFLFAVVALAVMATTSDFPSVTAFCYLVAAAGLQSLWSLVLAIVDAYALLVGRRLQNSLVVSLFAIGDGVTSNLTFAAACASAGITVLIGNDLDVCAKNHCTEFETATAMAFLSWFAALPSFLLNFWSLASR